MSDSVKKKGLLGWAKDLFTTKSYALEERVSEIIEENTPNKEELSSKEQLILANLLRFGEKITHEIMIPRSDIVAIDCAKDVSEFLAEYAKHAHTRVPVYQNSLDNIIGFVHIKDILVHKTNITEIVRPIITVPKSRRLVDLLQEMQHKRTHIAIVIDEYGCTDGMVTIEDIIESLVGDIYDEHDIEDNLHDICSDGLIVNGRIEVSDLESMLNINLKNEEDHFDTLNGLILEKTGSIPKKGDKIIISDNILAEIIDADPRVIKKVKIHYKAN